MRELSEPVREPQLAQRLPRYAHSARFPIQGLHHPSWEIDVDPLWVDPNTPSIAQIELSNGLIVS
jgi:hypothetical protein